MGRRSHIQKAMDEKMGAHLADFEEEVLGRVRRQIDERLTGRLDTLAEKEDRFNKNIQYVSKLVGDLNRSYTHFRRHITAYLVGVSLVSSMIGGLITFLLLWFFW